jgi:glycosyltransferase involved in cell wall biosynthesis
MQEAGCLIEIYFSNYKNTNPMPLITLSANSSWYLYNFRSSTITRALSKGYKVTCISPEDEYSQRLIKLGCNHYPINFKSKSKNLFLELFLIFKFIKAYFILKPSAVFHFTVKNNIYGTMAAALLGIPAINNISGLGTAFLKKSLVSFVVTVLYKISQPFAYKIFCQNTEDLNYFKDNRFAQSENLILIPGSGVDTKRFNPNLRISRPASHDEIFTFLYAGRMLRDKGLVELITAIRSINLNSIKCKLILCGFVDSDNISAISIDDIESWSLLPGIQWVGASDQIENIMSKVDCMVLPSYREGMPKSLIEGGSMGLPAVTTDVPGCRNIIQDGVNGFLCKPYSAVSLQSAMEQMLKISKEELHKLGERSRENILLKFDEQIVINSFCKVLDELIGNKQNQ